MPSGDRTGPMGQGSMTGRGLGYCEGHDSPGYEKGFGGRGRGYRYGRRMGRHPGYGRGIHWDWPFTGYNPPYWIPDKEDEIKILKSQAEELKRIQNDIEKRLNDLENRNK